MAGIWLRENLGPVPYNFFLCNLWPNYEDFLQVLSKFTTKIGRSYKSTIYGSDRFYGIGPRVCHDADNKNL